MALADAAFGAQNALQDMIKRRVMEQQAAADAQRQAEVSARDDRRLDLDVAKFYAGEDRNKRLDDATAENTRFTQGNVLAEQIPGGTFLPEDDPTAQKLPGYLRTRVEPRPAMGQDFAGPMPGGESPQEAQVGRPGGFLKTRTQNQTIAEQNAARQGVQDTRAQAQLDETIRHNQATEAQARAGLDARTKPETPPGQQSPYGQERTRRVLESVDNLMGQINNFTAGPGSLLSVVPGSPQRDFAAQLKTLQSNIAFSELQEMREASKTGGALGQVSERELDLLSSVLGSLDAGQSPDALRSQLQQVRESLSRWNAAKAGVATPEPGGGTPPPATGGGGRVYYDLDGNPVTR